MARGLGTSRAGRPLLGLQTLIDRIKTRKLAAASPVRTSEALDAARVLEQDPRTRFQRYRNAALTGGTLNPVVRGIGRAAEALVMAPKGQRLRKAGRALLPTNRGELARQVTEGVVGGGGVRAAQEGLEIGQARRKVVNYLNTPEKTAGQLAPAKTRLPLKAIASPDFDFEV